MKTTKKRLNFKEGLIQIAREENKPLSERVNPDAVDINKKIDNLKDEPGFKLTDYVGVYAITTKRHDFKRGHNYWIIVTDIDTDTHMGQPQNFITQAKRNQFEKAVALHYALFDYLS